MPWSIKAKDRKKFKPIKIPYGFQFYIPDNEKSEEEINYFCKRNGFLLCNGQEVTIHDFPELFHVIGYRYGGKGMKFCLPKLPK